MGSPLNSGDRGLTTTLLAVSWSQCALASILMGARLYSNLRVVRLVRSDFYWAFMTYLTGLTAQIFLTVSVYWGLGMHIKDLTPHQISRSDYFTWFFTTFAILSISLGKIAVIAFILQVQKHATNVHTWFLYFIGASSTIVNLTIIGIIWGQCSPVSKLWNPQIPGTCKGRKTNEKFGYFQGSWSAFCDVALAVYPIIVFWHLKIQLHVKVGLSALFALGLVAAACSAIKTKQIETVTKEGDISYEIAKLCIWASTEMWVVLIVGSIPPIRPLFVTIFHKISTIASHSHTSGAGYTVSDDKPHELNSVPRSYAYPGRQSDGTAILKESDSKENILPPGQENILMTTNISVAYEGSGASREREEYPEAGGTAHHHYGDSV